MIIQILFLSYFALVHSIDTVSTLDLTKYVGRWYQVYGDKYDETFQGKGHCNTADYTLIPNQNISVLNSQYSTSNELEQITGYAYYSEHIDSITEPGKLTVHLEGVLFEAPYWIYQLGPEYNGMYEWSIVSDPIKLSLFVLTRDVERFYEKYNSQVLEILNTNGFRNPIPISHDSCEYVIEPDYIYDSFKLNKIKYNKQSECQVAGYLRKSGFPESSVGTMVCISKYESSYDCDATNHNTDSSTDYGLFQINSYYWCSGDSASKYNECGTSCSSLFTCQTNSNCAYKVWKQQGYNAWYGYKYHKSECDNYKVNC